MVAGRREFFLLRRLILLGLRQPEVRVGGRQPQVRILRIVLDQVVVALQGLVVVLLVRELVGHVDPHHAHGRRERGVARRRLESFLEDGLGARVVAGHRVDGREIARGGHVAGLEVERAVQALRRRLEALRGLALGGLVGIVRRLLAEVGIEPLPFLDLADPVVERLRPVGASVVVRPLLLLHVALRMQTLDRRVERFPRLVRAVDFGVGPTQIGHRLEIVGVLLRALLELLDGLVDLALIVFEVALVLVVHRLHDVLDAARAVRIAGLGGSSEQRPDQRGGHAAPCDRVELHDDSSFR